MPFLARINEALDNAGEAIPVAGVVRERAEDLRGAIDAWKQLEATTAEARFPLSQFMAEVYAAAILCERAEWELAHVRRRPQIGRCDAVHGEVPE